jgi:hypothetical protein
MNRSAASHGFRRYNSVYFKPCETITKLVILQNSACLRIIVAGLLPSALIEHDAPPHNGYWGTQVRDHDMPIGHSEIFERKMFDYDNLVQPSELVTPVQDLFRWVDETWSDDARIREDILSNAEWCKKTLIYIMLRDWARGELKPWQKYWKTEIYPGKRNARKAAKP